MAEFSQAHNQASLRATASLLSPQQAEESDSTQTTSDAQTSNMSSSDSIQTSSTGSRSRPNTPSSLESSNAATSPENNASPAKTDQNLPPLAAAPAQYTSSNRDLPRVQHIRTTSQGSTGSRASPRTLQSHAEAINSGHRASQTLETIPQHELPPPMFGFATNAAQQISINSSAIDSDENSIAHSSPSHAVQDAEQHPDNASMTDSDTLTRTTTAGSWWQASSTWSAESRKKLSKSSVGQKTFGIASLTLAMFGTIYLSYRGYKLQQWQALAELYNVCQNVKPGQGRFEGCQDLLMHPLSDPPYSNPKRELEKAHRRRERRALELDKVDMLRSSAGAQGLIFYSLLGLALLTVFYTSFIWLCSRGAERRGGNHDAWRVARLRPVNRHHSDHFSPVNVRTASLHQETLSTGEDVDIAVKLPKGRSPTLPAHLRQKRQMLVPPDLRQSEQMNYKSFSPENNLTQRPSWKRDGLPRSDSVSLKDPDDASTMSSNLIQEEQDKLEEEPPCQLSDALKDTASNDLILQRSNSSRSSSSKNTFLGDLRKRLHTKYPSLPYYLPSGDDSSEDEPIMTAIGAEPYDSFDHNKNEVTHGTSQRKDVALSTFVAVAMAQAGATLASTAGGYVGRHLLVLHVENQAEEIHEMITTGKKRRLTDAARYEVEKKNFLDGQGVRGREGSQETAVVD